MPGQFLMQSIVEVIEKDSDDPKLERRWDRDKSDVGRGAWKELGKLIVA